MSVVLGWNIHGIVRLFSLFLYFNLSTFSLVFPCVLFGVFGGGVCMRIELRWK